MRLDNEGKQTAFLTIRGDEQSIAAVLDRFKDDGWKEEVEV